MKLRPFAWFHSLHAKLFTVTALVTSVLTVAVAFSITRNSRRELEKYSRNLVCRGTPGRIPTRSSSVRPHPPSPATDVRCVGSSVALI